MNQRLLIEIIIIKKRMVPIQFPGNLFQRRRNPFNNTFKGHWLPLYLFVMGILLSFPNALGVILIPGGDCLRLYSLMSTILKTLSISAFPMAWLLISPLS